jgi:hypothetical protein
MAKRDEKIIPDPALKWGITPGKHPPTYTAPEESYSPEEQEKREKLRKKGINPGIFDGHPLKPASDIRVDSKARMDAASKEGSFWTKVAGTIMGGGSIK